MSSRNKRVEEKSEGNKKVFLIGIDQQILPLTRKVLERGDFPNLKKLLAMGTVTQSISSYPPHTPTNWATIATGAESGTHGVFWWLTDTPDHKTVSAFHPYSVKAETIWAAAERQGIKSAVIHYPAGGPWSLSKSFVIDGDASPGYGESRFEITPQRMYTTRSISVGKAQRIEVKQSTEWRDLPPSSLPPLESVMKIISKFKGDDKDLILLFTSSTKKEYDTVHVYSDKNTSSKLATSKVGKWSGWVFEKFTSEGKERTGTFRLKLLTASRDGDVVIYRSQVMPLDGWTTPDGIGRELIEKIGPYLGFTWDLPYVRGLADLETCAEEAEYQLLWFADAARYLVREKGVQLFYCQWHYLDWVNHHHLGFVDPAWKLYDPNKAVEHWKAIERAYRAIDKALGRFFELLDKDSYLILTSDHGNLPTDRIVFMYRFLWQGGFLRFKDNSKPVSEYDPKYDESIDWENTTAYLRNGKHHEFSIYVNPKKATEKNRILEELIVKLRSWVDEKTGRTPIAIVLKKEEAAILGVWGGGTGDVVYLLEKGYIVAFEYEQSKIGSGPVEDTGGLHSAGHSSVMLTAQTEVCSNLAMTVFVGPGIKKGYAIPYEKVGYIRLTDIVPTISYILGIQPPQHSQGAVVYSIFEGNEPPKDRAIINVDDRETDPRLPIQSTMYDYSQV